MWSIWSIHKKAWTKWKEYMLSGVLMSIVAGVLDSFSVIPIAILVFWTTICCIFTPLTPFVSLIVMGAYTNILGLGMICFYMESLRTHQTQSIGMIFSGFKTGYYQENAKTLIMRNIFLFLWSMLLIIPGIVKKYEYSMIPYLMTDYPEKNQSELFDLSKQMTSGNKGKLFLMDLSFLIYMIPSIILQITAELTKSTVVMIAAGIVLIIFGIVLNPVAMAMHVLVYEAIREETLHIPQEISVSPMSYQKVGKLCGVQGEMKDAELTLEKGEYILIGRDPSICNLVLNSSKVSRQHVTVEFDGEKFYITDHSTNGTFDVEKGQFAKEQRTPVSSGTYIQLGNGGDIFQVKVE